MVRNTELLYFNCSSGAPDTFVRRKVLWNKTRELGMFVSIPNPAPAGGDLNSGGDMAVGGDLT